MTICNESVLKVLKDPEDVCNIVEPSSLHGSGKSSKSISVPYDGRFTITGSHSGEAQFLVEIVDQEKILLHLFSEQPVRITGQKT